MVLQPENPVMISSTQVADGGAKDEPGIEEGQGCSRPRNVIPVQVRNGLGHLTFRRSLPAGGQVTGFTQLPAVT